MSKWQRPAACSSGLCVEVWDDDGAVFHVRSTQRPEVVTFTRDEWMAFLDAVKAGEYD